jgi:serine/threonine protein kinase
MIEDIEDLFTKNSLEKKYVVGRGGFGRVWKVQSKKFVGKSYALKEMSKARILARKSL